MTVRIEGVVACLVMGVFFLVGVICYGVFPAKVPDEPVRIMFESKAGHILFDHKGHISEAGYGIECEVCHHEDADDPGRCGECHDADSEVTRTEAFHGKCKGCHEDGEAGPVQCSGCHVM